MSRSFAEAFEMSEPSNDACGWLAPDMALLNEHGKSPRFPKELLADFWPTIEALAVDKGAPVDFVAMSFLSVASSIIGNKRRAGGIGGWAEPAILWVGLVASPSVNKSPALRPFASIAKKLEAETLDDFEARMSLHQTEVERARAEHTIWQGKVKEAAEKGWPSPDLPALAKEPDPPGARRFLTNDTTPEALGDILRANPHGTLQLRDELQGWISSFDRYSNNSEEFWLSAYNGDAYTVDRKGRSGPLHIPCLGVSVLGGIQPDKLSRAFGGDNNGMASRFLWVWPDVPPFALPEKPADLHAFERIFRRLDSLQWAVDEGGNEIPKILNMTPDAKAVFAAYLKEVQEMLQEDDRGLFSSFIGKTKGMALRLALALELIEWAHGEGAEPTALPASRMEEVCSFLSDYAQPMAAKVYGDAAIGEDHRGAARIARWLRRRSVEKFNSREHILRQAGTFGFRRAEPLDDALAVLIEGNWIRATGSRKGGSVGRQSKDFEVNPAVRGG